MLILKDSHMFFADLLISGTLTMLGKGAPNLLSGVPRSWFLSASRGNSQQGRLLAAWGTPGREMMRFETSPPPNAVNFGRGGNHRGAETPGRAKSISIKPKPSRPVTTKSISNKPKETSHACKTPSGVGGYIKNGALFPGSRARNLAPPR